MTSANRRRVVGQLRNSDRGAVLPIVLVVVVVIGAVVLALAKYSTTTLRYGQVVEEKSDRLAAAEAGMRDMLEKVDVGRALQCLSGPTTYNLLDQINGASVSSECSQIGAGLSDIQGWSVIVTGEGVVGTPLPPPAEDWIIHTQAGNASDPKKRFNGPVYVQELDTTRAWMQSDLEIESGDVYYYDPACPGDTARTNVGATINNLTFSPASRGTYCTTRTWDSSFTQPPVPALPGGTPLSSTPTLTGGDCMVFEPGYYFDDDIVIDGQGASADNYYFKSGVYYFENVAITIDTAAVWAGTPGPGDVQEVDNDACEDVRSLDTTNGTGATFYFGGDSSFAVLKGNGSQPGAFEIFRRLSGNHVVSIQALCDTSGPSWCLSGGGTPSTLGPFDPIVSTGTGNNKQMVIHGTAWAPEAQIQFGLVTNQAQGQLLGGAIFATFDVGASANASGFVVSGTASPVQGDLLIESTATKNGLSTTVESVVEYRPLDTTFEYAVKSYRVVD